MNNDPWFDPASVKLTSPADRGEGVSIYNVAGVRSPEKEYDKYLKLIMSKSGKNLTIQDRKTLNLLNFWADLAGKTKYTINSQGRIIPETTKMPPAWS